jgi:hypothetical protein
MRGAILVSISSPEKVMGVLAEILGVEEMGHHGPAGLDTPQ